MSKKTFYLTPEGKLQHDLSEEEICAAYQSGEGLLWIDILDIGAAETNFLEQGLRFHHLVVEDCVSLQIHPSKIDAFADYLFIIVHGINHVTESDIVETAELELFLGKNFVVSIHILPLYSIAAIQETVEDSARPMKRGADFLAHAIIDALVDNVMPTIDRMTDVAGEIEEEIIRRPQQTVLEGILKLKRSALKVHRVMAPQRDVLNRLSRGEFAMIKPEALIFYRDVYDHIARIEDLNQNVLDRTDNALATYLSSVANRQNETMKVLSIVATIFLPLTLLAGIYGMNFEYMPELSWRYGYFTVLGVILLVVIIVVWRFWAGGWFARGRKMAVGVKRFTVEGKKLRGYFSLTGRRHRPGNARETSAHS